MPTWLAKIWIWCVTLTGRIKWSKFVSWLRGGKPYWDLTPDELAVIREMLASNYYVILTYRKTHLSSYGIGFIGWLKTGKWSRYTHSLMNLEGPVVNDDDFRLVEATGKGVHLSTFEEVFDCDRVCLLRPKGYDATDWIDAMDALLQNQGKPYDNLFNLADDTSVSCVELVRDALMAAPDYAANFAAFERDIAKRKNLIPQMFRDCPDFEVVIELIH